MDDSSQAPATEPGEAPVEATAPAPPVEEPSVAPPETPVEAPAGTEPAEPAPEPTPESVLPPSEEVAELAVEPAEPAAEPEKPTREERPRSASDSSPPPTRSGSKENAAKSARVRKQKVDANLEKILAKTREKGKITNRDVVKLLRVTDTTANRYLNALVVRGQLKRSGKGRGVVYTI